MDNEIFLNGEKIFTWPYGYSQFEIDLTSYVKEGENTIWVKTPMNFKQPLVSGLRHLPKRLACKTSCRSFHNRRRLSGKKKEGDAFYSACRLRDSKRYRFCLRGYSLPHSTLHRMVKWPVQVKKLLPFPCGLTVNKQTMIFEAPLLWDIESPNLYTVHSEIIKRRNCLLIPVMTALVSGQLPLTRIKVSF